MIWTAVIRLGTLMSVATAVLHLYDERTRAINASRIYRTPDAARFLGISRKDVVKLIKANDIKATLVNGNYRILGQNIIEYLNR
ncbi:helix-turn-helix domain-containing protein [Magnetovibrio sp. PR-2]|uniref:helix-turn-helix domain-containing protein n=1 Tax=Magnetovibrio sp. PR-2 TaxID=3120356 RepID=UPI002FCE1332